MKLKSNGQGFGDAQTTIERILDLTILGVLFGGRNQTRNTLEGKHNWMF